MCVCVAEWRTRRLEARKPLLENLLRRLTQSVTVADATPKGQALLSQKEAFCANGVLTSHPARIGGKTITGTGVGANALIEFNEVDSLTGAPGGGQTNTFDGILIINSAASITVR